MRPASSPGWETIVSVVVLGVVGTAFAYLLFFTLIAGAGATYASFVTYLIPPIALAYGALFLDEGVGASALGGMVLILVGVALGTGSPEPRAVRERPATVVGGSSFARAPSEPS